MKIFRRGNQRIKSHILPSIAMFLIFLIVMISMPVANTLWREVLGVSGKLDEGLQVPGTRTPFLPQEPTLTPTVLPTQEQGPSATVEPLATQVFAWPTSLPPAATATMAATATTAATATQAPTKALPTEPADTAIPIPTATPFVMPTEPPSPTQTTGPIKPILPTETPEPIETVPPLEALEPSAAVQPTENAVDPSPTLAEEMIEQEPTL